MNLNAPPPSSFPVHQLKDDYDQQQHYNTYPQNQTIILSNSSSSSSVSSYRIQLKNPMEDHKGYYETLNHESQCNKVNSVLKFTLWKQPHHGEKEDHKMDSSSDLSSYTSPSPYNNANLIRVCADCTTTKTPLWRSGPKGPKSLCNACGIRQRKARRAMAAAESGDRATAASYRPPAVKIKLRQKEKIGKSGHSPRLKKPCKMAGAATAAGSSSSMEGPRKLNLEDFLISLSRSLSIQRVFPEDEKDAAILLMAISSGLVHG